MPDHRGVFWTRCDAILKRASLKGGLLFKNNREKGMDFHVCGRSLQERRGQRGEARVFPFPRVYAVFCLVQEESSDGQENQSQRAGQVVGSAGGTGLGASGSAGAGRARGGCTIVSACSLLPSQSLGIHTLAESHGAVAG